MEFKEFNKNGKLKQQIFIDNEAEKASRKALENLPSELFENIDFEEKYFKYVEEKWQLQDKYYLYGGEFEFIWEIVELIAKESERNMLEILALHVEKLLTFISDETKSNNYLDIRDAYNDYREILYR